MSAMADFYIAVIEQTGLDIEDEASMDTVAAAMYAAPRDLNAIDLFDHIVDSLTS